MKKQFRTSLYTIFINLEDSSGDYLIIHGYSGAIDHASQKVANFLRSGIIFSSEDLDANLLPFSIDTFNRLVSRGYITEKSPLDEKEVVRKMAEAFHKRDKLMKNFLFLVAYDCNFRCPYCFENAISNNGKGWSKKVFTKNAVDKAYAAMLEVEPNRNLHQNRITLYGGEPLLMQNKEVVNYIVEQGVERNYNFMAITNGYDLEHFQNLLKPGSIDWLQISFDGSKKKHDSRRTHYLDGESYDKILSNLEMTLAQGIRVSIRINTDLNNFDDIIVLREEFERLGFFKNKDFSVYSALVHGEEEMNCNAVMSKPNEELQVASVTEKVVSNNLFLDEQIFDPDQQYIDFDLQQSKFKEGKSAVISFHDEDSNHTEQIHTINRGKYVQKFFDAINSDEKLSSISCQDFGIRNKLKSALESNRSVEFRSVFCTAQTGMMIFDPYGDLYNCWETVGLDKHKVGSYRNGIELIDEELEHWQGRNISKTPACSKCKYAFFCGGGCQARALKEGRGYNSPYCDGYPKTFQKIALDTYQKFLQAKVVNK